VTLAIMVASPPSPSQATTPAPTEAGCQCQELPCAAAGPFQLHRGCRGSCQWPALRGPGLIVGGGNDSRPGKLADRLACTTADLPSRTLIELYFGFS
jgi:hypothetical protein